MAATYSSEIQPAREKIKILTLNPVSPIILTTNFRAYFHISKGFVDPIEVKSFQIGIIVVVSSNVLKISLKSSICNTEYICSKHNNIRGDIFI
jgi:hypothetical protein